MLTCMRNSIRLAVMFSLILVSGWSAAWAVNHYSDSMVGKKNKKANMKLVNNGPNKIRMTVQKGAVDDYLNEQGLKKVEITAELDEQWIDLGDGEGYYQLDFTFGPSGTYFDPPLELEFQGSYFTEISDVTLYGEDGEELESEVHQGSNKITYYIPHFSSYSYDHYGSSRKRR